MIYYVLQSAKHFDFVWSNNLSTKTKLMSNLQWNSWVICNGTFYRGDFDSKTQPLNHCIWLLKVRKMLSFILLVTVKIRHKFVFLQKFTSYTSLGVVKMIDTIAHDDLDFVQWKIVLFWCQTCANDSRNFMIKKKKFEPWCVFRVKFVKNRVNFLLSFGFFYNTL